MSNPIIENLYGKKGFFDELSISQKDLETIRELILSQFRIVLSMNYPELDSEIMALQIQDYHEFEQKHQSINHSILWPKVNRIFSYDSKEIFRNLDFFQYLEAQLGAIQITNEEEIHDEEKADE